MKTPAEKLLIGAHTSAAGGVHNALVHGQEIGATTIQLFTANQRQWTTKPIPAEEVELWKESAKKTGIKKVMSHDSYLINLGTPDAGNLAKSQAGFKEELHRCQQLGVAFLNFHPGAAVSGTEEQCLDQIVASLLSFEEQVLKGDTLLVLETTAGQGSSVGHKFEHIGYIFEHVHKKFPVGVCIDTCHIFCAGYDIRTAEGWEETLKKFDELIGLKHLSAFHVNDSMKPFNSRLDRHAHLGKGEIGIECFKVMMQHPKLREIPKYLETPEPEFWKDEIAMLRNFAQ